jgi:hypothetical protein
MFEPLPDPLPDPSRVLAAQIGAHSSWAKTPDRSARTSPARRAFMIDRFEREVDPDGLLPPQERAKRADNARKAYFLQLAAKSAKARRNRSEANGLRRLAAQALAAADDIERDAVTAPGGSPSQRRVDATSAHYRHPGGAGGRPDPDRRPAGMAATLAPKQVTP